jgi:hypothetical protein
VVRHSRRLRCCSRCSGDHVLGRISRITPLDSRDASTPDDDASLDE